MTNKFVFDKGKIVENFNYIRPDDPYNDYIGNLIDYGGILYEIVTDLNGTVIYPDDYAVVVANNGVKEIYDHIDYLNSKPLNISDKLDNNTSFQGDVFIDEGRIYYNGIEIIPLPDDDTDDTDTAKINEFKENTVSPVVMPTINYVDNRFF